MDGSISMRKSKWVEIFLLSLLMMAVLCYLQKGRSEGVCEYTD